MVLGLLLLILMLGVACEKLPSFTTTFSTSSTSTIAIQTTTDTDTTNQPTPGETLGYTLWHATAVFKQTNWANQIEALLEEAMKDLDNPKYANAVSFVTSCMTGGLKPVPEPGKPNIAYGWWFMRTANINHPDCTQSKFESVLPDMQRVPQYGPAKGWKGETACSQAGQPVCHDADLAGSCPACSLNPFVDPNSALANLSLGQSFLIVVIGIFAIFSSSSLVL